MVGRRFVLCAVMLLGLSACSKRRYKMPSGSMWPSIPVGETVTADTSIKTPARGDVFVFKLPEHPEQSFVKRIVALPGDRVETKGRTLLVNGKAVPSCVVGPFAFQSEGARHEGDLVLEGAGYLVFHEKESLSSDGAWTVGEGQFWAMGDNRNNSHDSRMWFGGNGGGVPSALIEGKVATTKAALPAGADALAPGFEKCKKELGAAP
jgi:signal peptidase I